MSGHGAVDGRSARWAGQRQRRRAQFVAAGIAAIVEYGPRASAEEIAAHAGVARPLLYRYFHDAQDLHTAIGDRIGDLVLAQLHDAFGQPCESVGALTERVVGALAGWLIDHANLYRYLAERPDPGPGVLAEVKTRTGDELAGLLTGYASAFGADPGLLDPAAFALVGMVETTTARWLDAPGCLDRATLVTRLAGWAWALIEHTVRAAGVAIDRDQPLPTLPTPPASPGDH